MHSCGAAAVRIRRRRLSAAVALCLCFLVACSSSLAPSTIQVTLFNESGAELRVRIDIDGFSLYGGLASTAANNEPNVALHVAERVPAGRHTITVVTSTMEKSVSFEVRSISSIEVRIKKSEVVVTVRDGAILYI